jgi:hypothetical protein
MKRFPKLFIVFLLLAFVILPGGSAQARGMMDGKIIFGENFTLEKGQTMNGDLVVFGGNVVIEEGAAVEGSIVLFGGNLTQNGLVTGDVVMFGGNASIGGKGVVEGDAVTIGGQLSVAQGGEIKGERVTNIPAPVIETPKIPEIPKPSAPGIEFSANPFFNALNMVFRALAVAALSMLVVVFLQPQVERVGQAIVHQPFVAGGIGLLTLFAAPLALVLLAVTIILIPVAFVSALLLVLAWLFGIIAIGQEVGERFTKAINQTWAPVLATGFGTFLLMVVGGSINMIPCVGWIVPFVIGLIGIGGVIMTWFGTRQAQGARMSAPAEPLPPAS